MPAPGPLAEAERRLREREAVDDGALLRLADARALRIKAQVADSLHLPIARLFLRTPQVAAGARDGRVPCALGLTAD